MVYEICITPLYIKYFSADGECCITTIIALLPLPMSRRRLPSPGDKLSQTAKKMDDVHFNPVSSHWKLLMDELEYYYSSARFYENGVNDFGFLFDLYREFDGD